MTENAQARSRGEFNGDPETQALPPVDYWPQVAAAREAGFGTTGDVLTRYCMIGLAGLLLWFVKGEVLFLIWVIFYVAMNLLLWRVINRMQAPVHRAAYLRLAVLHGGSSLLFAAMPVYVWMTSDPVPLKALAAAGIFSHALFALAYQNDRSLLSVTEQVWIVAGVLAIGILEIARAESFADQLVVAMASAAVVGYYIVAQISMIRDREALRRSRETELQAQKITVISRVTAKIAHDFNNILTAIQGNIEIAEMTRDPMERREVLSEAKKASLRAAGIVAQMMAYVRKSPLNVRKVSIYAYLEDLQENLARYLPESIDIRVAAPDENFELSMDKALLDTALLNLALNARDAIGQEAGAGWLSLTVSLTDAKDWPGEPPQARGPFVLFRMQDSGPGIPAELIGQVSEPFFTTKDASAGPGLGLSMVSGFAGQSGGSLHLRNAGPKGGLVVSLLLPVAGPMDVS